MLFLYLDGIKYGYKTDRLSNTIAAPRAKSENSPMENSVFPEEVEEM